MKIDDQIEDEKLQYCINIEAAKTAALSSGKIDKYEYLIGEETLSSNQKKKKKRTSYPLERTHLVLVRGLIH